MADDYKPTIDTFLRDVADHKMTGHIDNGAYRHITFSRPGSSVYRFHITTWPGYLCISGDMGCFVFSRLTDMFEFFREKNINPQYWAEKIQATNKHGGHREFSGEYYVDAIKADFEGWDFDSDEQREEAWKAIEDDWDGLLRHADDRDMNHAIREAMEWKCPVTGQEFHDFYEHTLEGYTYHFIWCCRAIRWAIEQYDAATTAVELKEAA
ncbi:hypothetical protein [Sinorhizobium meliloti]|uniref:hypothetical protein n=1 Tax=Rhizobium meliloti TaxID=382 RepID=UPI000FD95EFD|nr:hypothetical protein [Sinorhizobium meliloti]RVL37959.1 hypothetical protein CN148_11575 [Sinorhizobium meliloti]